MKLPSVLVQILLVGLTAGLTYAQGHVGDFGLNDLIAPFVLLAIGTALKAIQEWRTPAPVAGSETARGFVAAAPPRSFAARLLYL